MGFEMESNLLNGYMEAFNMACNELCLRNPADVIRNAEVQHDASSGTFTLSYIGVPHVVDCMARAVSRLTPEGPVSVGTTVGILILHYLLHAVKRPVSGRLISFREVLGVSVYFPTFHKRAILPLQGTFEEYPDALVKAGLALGGETSAFGDASVTLRILPLVPITYVVWRGDDEIPASATILFDETVTSYLPGEDIVLAASFGTYALMKRAKG
jgi:hypothetical protein